MLRGADSHLSVHLSALQRSPGCSGLPHHAALPQAVGGAARRLLQRHRIPGRRQLVGVLVQAAFSLGLWHVLHGLFSCTGVGVLCAGPGAPNRSRHAAHALNAAVWVGTSASPHPTCIMMPPHVPLVPLLACRAILVCSWRPTFASLHPDVSRYDALQTNSAASLQGHPGGLHLQACI